MGRFIDVGKIQWGGEESPLVRGPLGGPWATMATKDIDLLDLAGMAAEELDDPADLAEAYATKEAALPSAFKFSEEDRTIPFVASEQSEDRQGDIVLVGGMSLKDFRLNPVLMPFHMYDQLPLGTVPRILRAGIQIRGLAKFSKVPGNDLAHVAFGMMWEKELRGFSVGFVERITRLRRMKTDAEESDKDNVAWRMPGRLFAKSVLLEESVAPIPAHQNALAERNRKDAAYLVTHLAEAVVGHSQEHLDVEAAVKVVERLVDLLSKQATPTDPQDAPVLPDSAGEPSSTSGDPGPTAPDSKQVDEVCREAADYVLQRLSLK